MSVSLKTVVLVQTRNPASLAALMPSMAASKTPSRSTAMSWFFCIPSRWTLKKNRRWGLNSSIFLRMNMPLVQR